MRCFLGLAGVLLLAILADAQLRGPHRHTSLRITSLDGAWARQPQRRHLLTRNASLPLHGSVRLYGCVHALLAARGDEEGRGVCSAGCARGSRTGRVGRAPGSAGGRALQGGTPGHPCLPA